MSFIRSFTHILLLSLLFISLSASGYAIDITLEWDANKEPDLWGYRVYYKTGSAGHGVLSAYDGSDLKYGDPNGSIVSSGFDIIKTALPEPNAPTVTLSGLTNSETYCFVVTAFDMYDFESDASNEVCFTSNITRTMIDKAISEYKDGSTDANGVKQKIYLYME